MMQRIININKLKNTLIVGLLSLMGCSDFLYQEPNTQISIDEQFSTEEGLLQTVNGIYYKLESLVSGKYFVYADMLGGNVTFTPNGSSELQISSTVENAFAYDDKEDDSDYYYFYKDAYSVINQANMILLHLNDAADVETSKRQQIQAEVTAIRGYLHYIVSQLYSQNMNYTSDGSHLGIIYNTSVLEAGKDYPSRETKNDTYTLIMSDLNEALSLFTGESALDYGPANTYLNAINTKALIARIALDHGQWATAFAAADSVLNNTTTPFIAKDDYIEAWTSSTAMPEALMELSTPVDIAFAPSSSLSNEFFYYYITTNTSTNTSYLTYKSQGFVASSDLINTFESNDIRLQLYTPIAISAITNGIKADSTFYFVEKFQNDHKTTIMRLSELYLIRSEARFMMNNSNLTDALADLNVTRERAGLTALHDLIAEEYMDELYLERRRELAFEGHLFFDHMRFQKEVSRGEDSYGAPQKLSYPNEKFVLPLPKSTLDVNEYLEQNEDY